MKQDWDIRRDKPLVSVCTITYNHVPYIRQCLDSILSQETGFPFELIVHDDASTDGTTEIVREYAEKYPQIIVPLFQTENQYSKGIKISPTYVLPKARGKYLALCEGDDYWPDGRKLQQQADLLESNGSLVLVHSDYDYIKVPSGKRQICRHRMCGRSNMAPSDKRQLLTEMLIGQYFIKTCTVMTRTKLVRNIINSSPTIMSFPMGDTPLFCEISQRGEFAFINKSLAAYHSLQESASNTSNPDKAFRFAKGKIDVARYMAKKYHLSPDLLKTLNMKEVMLCNRYAVESGNRTEIEALYKSGEYVFPTKEKIIYWATMFNLGRWAITGYFHIRNR